MSSDRKLSLLAAALGASGVTLGAFGAHALASRFDDRQMRNWSTAVQYQLIHALAILATSSDPRMRRAGLAWAAGTTLFSGSIYMLSLGWGPRALFGPMTPVGGSLMIAGWILAGVARF